MKIANLFKGDKAIWAVFLFLCLISIVEVFSASSSLTYKTHNFLSPLIYHSGTIVAGVFVAIVILNIPCRYFKLLTPIMLVATYATLVGVLIWGQSINGANRVIQLPGFTFQPSEIAKGTMVLATAQILSALQRDDGSGADPKAMKYILIVSVPAVLLILIENLSTGILLFGVIYVMMFIGRVPIKQIGQLTGVLVLLAGLFLALVFSMASLDKEGKELEMAERNETTIVQKAADDKQDRTAFDAVTHRFWTWKNRLTKGSSTKNVAPEDYDVKNNFQVAHANFAIASSGIIGKGPGNSVERDYLPQAFSDFIYAIIIEEMGILGAIAVVLFYVTLLVRVARLSSRCENNFPAFLIMGLALLLVFQACINMLVAVDVGPVTGQPLPLISKGGTSTIVNCAYIGVILSVSRSAKKTQPQLKPLLRRDE